MQSDWMQQLSHEHYAATNIKFILFYMCKQHYIGYQRISIYLAYVYYVFCCRYYLCRLFFADNALRWLDESAHQKQNVEAWVYSQHAPCCQRRQRWICWSPVWQCLPGRSCCSKATGMTPPRHGLPIYCNIICRCNFLIVVDLKCLQLLVFAWLSSKLIFVPERSLACYWVLVTSLLMQYQWAGPLSRSQKLSGKKLSDLFWILRHPIMPL